MTKAQVIFDPFSEEFFNNPFDMYRQMRQEAPLFYNEDSGLLRPRPGMRTCAAALKDHEAFSSSRGCDLAMVQSDEPPQKSIIFMDPPDHRHMRSLLNKAFTPRMIQSQRDTVVEQIDHHLRVDQLRRIRCGARLLRSVPGRGASPAWPASSPEYRQQVRHWIDTSLSREPGQMVTSEAGMQANIDTGIYYYGLVQKRREDPQDDMISRLIAAEIPGEDGQMRRLDDIEITGFATLLGGAGAETGHQTRRHRDGVVRAQP